MEVLIAVLVGFLYAAGVYMLLRRSIVKFIIGIILLGNATNLLVFLSAGLTAGSPAFLGDPVADHQVFSDPLPQALVLTAVVISLGIVVFTIALKYKFFEVTGSDDLDQLKPTDDQK